MQLRTADGVPNAATQVTRTVNVVDTTAPPITLTGPDPQVIECTGTYVELGATALDACEGDLVSGSRRDENWACSR